MYTKEQASAIRQKFWTKFGQYMSPVPPAGFEKVNWVNYKTGIKGIFFKADVDQNTAKVFIEINIKDMMLQHQYFEIFDNFATQFEKIVGEGWYWRKQYQKETGETVSIISIELKHVTVFDEQYWPSIISFFKQHLMALDRFWNDFKPAFETI